jgi:hypothetical protein
MVTHKKQHWVPQCYLKAWVDPEAPAGHEPYVHVFNRHAAEHRRRAPANIFTMPDLYTIFQGVERNLRIEQAFARWEGDFVRVRSLFEAGQFGTGDDAADLYAFLGAMLARPPHQIEFLKKQWAGIADHMRSIRIKSERPTNSIAFQWAKYELSPGSRTRRQSHGDMVSGDRRRQSQAMHRLWYNILYRETRAGASFPAALVRQAAR